EVQLLAGDAAPPARLCPGHHADADHVVPGRRAGVIAAGRTGLGALAGEEQSLASGAEAEAARHQAPGPLLLVAVVDEEAAPDHLGGAVAEPRRAAVAGDGRG